MVNIRRSALRSFRNPPDGKRCRVALTTFDRRRDILAACGGRLGPALIAIKGRSALEVDQTYTRARFEPGLSIADVPQLFLTLGFVAEREGRLAFPPAGSRHLLNDGPM